MVKAADLSLCSHDILFSALRKETRVRTSFLSSLAGAIPVIDRGLYFADDSDCVFAYQERVEQRKLLTICVV